MFKSFLRKRNKETSVLNTDSFDKRRFNQIYEMSKGLQELNTDEEFPLFKELLSDIWAALYKVSPELKDEDDIGQHLEANRQLIERLMQEESYKDYHEETKLDDMLSAIASVKFGRETHHWLEQQRQQDEELKKQMEQVQQLMQQLSKEQSNQEDSEGGAEQNGDDQGRQGQNEGNKSETEQNFNEAMSKLASQLNQSLQQNSQSFSQAIGKAVKDTKDAKEGLESLFGGFEAGTQQGELQKMLLRKKIELAEMLTHDNKLKEIAKWAGRYTKIARTKQKMKHKESTEQSGIEQGNDIERVLPSELVQYINPVTKNDFLKRYAEGQLMQYEQKGKESLGQGSIVLCLDQSGSMEDLEMQSKGFALALIAIAKRQKRNFAYIPFDYNVGEVMQFPKGRIRANEMIKIASEFMSGGTDFLLPLKESLNIIKKDRFKDADIVFVTDGHSHINHMFLEEFNEIKEKERFNVMSLVIGNQSKVSTIERFSDRVVQITNFDDVGVFEAFEI